MTGLFPQFSHLFALAMSESVMTTAQTIAFLILTSLISMFSLFLFLSCAIGMLLPIRMNRLLRVLFQAHLEIDIHHSQSSMEQSNRSPLCVLLFQVEHTGISETCGCRRGQPPSTAKQCFPAACRKPYNFS